MSVSPFDMGHMGMAEFQAVFCTSDLKEWTNKIGAVPYLFCISFPEFPPPASGFGTFLMYSFSLHTELKFSATLCKFCKW